jgi:hypothetical protein
LLNLPHTALWPIPATETAETSLAH